MKISRIDTFTNAFVCFVRLTGEDGSEGWGQVAPYCADITAQVLHRQVAPYVLGQQMEDIDALGDRAGTCAANWQKKACANCSAAPRGLYVPTALR